MSYELSQKDLQLYAENGYLVIERFFSEDYCNSMIEEARLVSQNNAANMLNLHLRSSKYHDLLVNPGILKLTDKIQQAKMIPIGSIFFFCKPCNPLENGSNLHQDNYAVRAPLGSYFVCGVAFDDADETNGSLIVAPKTHKLGDLPTASSKNFDFDDKGRVTHAYPIGNPVKLPEGYKAIQLTYHKGSLILLHGNTIHGAPVNPSQTKWRHTIYLHYIKDGDPFWPGWNARRQLIERDKKPNSS